MLPMPIMLIEKPIKPVEPTRRVSIRRKIDIESILSSRFSVTEVCKKLNEMCELWNVDPNTSLIDISAVGYYDPYEGQDDDLEAFITYHLEEDNVNYDKMLKAYHKNLIKYKKLKDKYDKALLKFKEDKKAYEAQFPVDQNKKKKK